MEKRKVSTLRKKIVGILCIAAMTSGLAASMAMSVMAVPEQATVPEIVTEAVSLPQYADNSVMDESNAIRIQLGPDLIENNQITLNLDQNGATYLISGSNEINDAFVDTTICVPSGITVHVIFDGAQITNDDGVFTCAGPIGVLDLLNIEGTMNVYTKADSKLACVSSTFNGTVNFYDYGEQSGTFTLTDAPSTNARYLNTDGTFNILEGKVNVFCDDIPPRVTYNVSGGELNLKAGLIYDYNIVLTGGVLTIESTYGIISDPKNAAGEEMTSYTVTLPDVTEPTEITQLGSAPWQDLYTDDAGQVQLWLPDSFFDAQQTGYLYTADGCYKLTHFAGEVTAEKQDVVLHTVTYLMPDGSSYSVLTYDGGNVALPADPSCSRIDYVTEEGAFDGQNITKDYTVTVSKYCTVTIDGVENTFQYGSMLPMLEEKGFAEASGAIYTESFPITRSMTLYTVKTAVKDSIAYAAIENEEDIRAYAELIDKNVSVPGLLMADLTMPSDVRIAFESDFKSVFDGNGHTLTVHYTDSSVDGAAVFGVLDVGAVIRNLTVEGDITSGVIAGGIAVAVNDSAVIENCTSRVNITLTSPGSGAYAGGIAMNAGGATFRNCVFDGSIVQATVSDSQAYLAGITAFSNNSSVYDHCLMTGTIQGNAADEISAFYGYSTDAELSNCYYESGNAAWSREQGTGVTAAQLASGEISYLLGEGWGQDLTADSKPSLGGPKVYQVNGYADCDPDTQPVSAYSNTDADIRPAHTYQNGKCGVCGTFEDGIGAQLLGHTLTISQDEILLNLYLELDPSVVAAGEDTHVDFTAPDGSVESAHLSKAVQNADGSYTFSCRVLARYIHEEYTAQVISPVGNGTVYHCSVADYVNTILENKDSNAEYAAAADLVQALSDYGTYAKAYFDPEAAAVPMTPELEGLVIPADTTTFENELPDGLSYYGTSLLLNSHVVLRHYLVAEDPVAANRYGLMHKSGKYYFIERDFGLLDLFNQQSIKIGDWTITSSPMNYVSKALAQTSDEKLQALVKSLYNYAIRAQEYAAAKGGEA